MRRKNERSAPWRFVLGMAMAAIATYGQGAQAEAVCPAVPAKVELFALRDVRLLAGPLQSAQETDRAYLLRLNPDRFLHHLRKAVGLTPKAEPYGGWDRGGAGMIGHYLTACAQMAEATGDATLKKRVGYIVAEMALCQRAGGDGGLYPSAWDKGYFDALAAGTPRWPNVTPWYTVHKIMAGLRDAYLLCGNEQARDVLIRMSDWCEKVTARLTPEQWQRMLDAEHGSPHEILADVYALTGKRKYLDLARKFRHNAVFDPLARGDATALDTRHANTQIPKFIAYERIGELDGETSYRNAARNFWTAVVGARTWANGGNSQWEWFFPPDEFSKKVNEVCGPETCNTYNMLKLTRDLYVHDPAPAFVDYYERALYNSILPSQDPGKGGFVYYTSMRPGHYRVYSRDEDAMWCCVGTGMENHGKYGEMIYAHTPNALIVNLFVPSVLHWGEKGLTLRQETRFPETASTRLCLNLQSPQTFTLRIRWPRWIANKMEIRVNGVAQKGGGMVGGFLSLSRRWKSGDTVEVSLPMQVTTELLPHSRNEIAFLYGPILLAAPLGTEGLTPADFHTGGDGDAQLAKKVISLSKVPVLVGHLSRAASQVVPVEGKPLTFQTRKLAHPHEVMLVPFYTVHEQRYALYWRIFDRATYAVEKNKLDIEERELLALERQTVDRVRVGEQQPEADHRLNGEGTHSGGASYPFTHWRDANAWFSYEVRVSPNASNVLRCAYWGGDKGRRFDILINGAKIATEELTAQNSGGYLYRTYPIPLEQTSGKTTVTVRFQAAPGSLAGGLFDLRVLKVLPDKP